MSDGQAPGTGSPLPLRALQESLVAALLLDGAAPAGVDPAAVQATRRQLLDKRARVVAAHWPALMACLGPDWPDAFLRWADGRAPAGGLVDGYRFAVAVADGSAGPAELPPVTARTVAAILLQWKESRAGFVPRRGIRTATVRGVHTIAVSSRSSREAG